jgi:tagatose-1,6-bisphosphate aldolase
MRESLPERYNRSAVRTTAKSRALQQLTTEEGRLAIVANDQRRSLVTLRERSGLPAGAEDLRVLNADIVAALAPTASGVLLDPEFALPALVDDAVVSRDTGILVVIERSGSRDENGLRGAEPVIAPAEVRRLGGTATKLLVCVRRTGKTTTARMDGSSRGWRRTVRPPISCSRSRSSATGCPTKIRRRTNGGNPSSPSRLR